MYQYKNEKMLYYKCTFPSYLCDKHIEELPFTHPDNRVQDEACMRQTLPRVLSTLRALRSQIPMDDTPIAAPDEASLRPDICYVFKHFKTEQDDMRVIIFNLKRFITHPKYFIIGFFSKLQNVTESVARKVIALDTKLVAALGKFPSILGYITCRREDIGYFNFVFLEDESAVAKWRAFATHAAALDISPHYYDWVRINHAILPCSLETLMGSEGGEKKLEIIRTKYFFYKDGQCVWRGLRKYKADEVFHSLPEHQPIKPLVFASFLGENAFGFYRQIVEYIGKTTGLPIQMIDVAALTRDLNPRPQDIYSILKYNIDFAFTCGLGYVMSFPNLIPLAAPVRHEERYYGRPVYYADIIVNSASPYYKIEDVKDKTFVINESISYSGCQLPEYHFRDQGGLEKYFSKVVTSKSHANSMNFIRDGLGDVAAIDSVVLEMELAQRPERRGEFRVIDTTQPNAMPPVVASAWVPLRVQELVKKALLKIHTDEHKLQLLNENGFSKFVQVYDNNYTDIREVITYVQSSKK